MADSRHLDLDVLEDVDNGEPACTFTLAGREWSCRHADDLPFDVVAQLFTGEDNGQTLTKVAPFFKAVLFRDQVDDFLEILHDEDSPLTLGRVRPLIEHVAKNVLGRPTRRPASSARGSRPKAPTSTDD